ncbi:CoA transferase [Microbacterium alcoholitolerans]|uniref:CoA transferase n=1 Tax=unclassified Microbacterium TaxID=2609290 RepID=UPI003D16B55E
MSGSPSAAQPRTPVPLPAHLPAGDLAWVSVTAAAAAIGAVAGTEIGASVGLAPPLRPDPARIAAAYRSDRHLLIDGAQPDVWAPLSRFWRTRDGWVRTHGNYPHHAAALRRGLGLPPEGDEHRTAERLESLLAMIPSRAATKAISDAGGLCVTVRRESAAVDAALRQHPLLEVDRFGDAPARPLRTVSPSRPLADVRVLDLTRVIAGPVASRTLALAGADVLRIDPPTLPEFAWQHLDTGHGKRTALLDIGANRERFDRLLAAADVVVLGYRPDGLDRLGLSPGRLIRQQPHLVVARLSAWADPSTGRGFDSLVQAASGISWLESPDSETPAALPAQALDHSAGYLLAAGIADALRRRAVEGGGWSVRTSLRRVAAELLGMPHRGRAADTSPPPVDPETQSFDVAGRKVTTVAPAVVWDGGPTLFAAPREWGADQPEW